MSQKNQDIPNKSHTFHEASDLEELLQNLMTVFKKMEAAESDGRWDFGTGDLLTSTEINTIEVVGHNSGLNITDLAELRGLSKSSISQIISRLSEKNLVHKYRKIDNEKEILIALTPRGEIAFLGHEQFHAQVKEQLMDNIGPISEEEIKNLMRICKGIEKTSEWIVQRLNKQDPYFQMSR